jgi:hypothetical protein
MNATIGSAKGKLVLTLETKETKLSKKGEKEGREEQNNHFEKWYLKKRRRDNRGHVHRYRQ